MSTARPRPPGWAAEDSVRAGRTQGPACCPPRKALLPGGLLGPQGIEGPAVSWWEPPWPRLPLGWWPLAPPSHTQGHCSWPPPGSCEAGAPRGCAGRSAGHWVGVRP